MPSIEMPPDFPPEQTPAEALETEEANASRRWSGWGAATLLTMTLLGAGPRIMNHQQLWAQARRQSQELPRVMVAEPVYPKTRTLSLPGNLTAFTYARIDARASGQVAKVQVELGAHVQAGQLLAVIQAPELTQQQAQAQADAQKALEGTRAADAEVLRSSAALEQTRAQQQASAATAQQAENTLKSAQIRFREAQQALRAAQARQLRARSALKLADSNLAREETLLAQGYVTVQDADTLRDAQVNAQAGLTTAEADVSTAESEMGRAQLEMESAQAGLRGARALLTGATHAVGVAHAALQGAKAGLASARAGSASGLAAAQRAKTLEGYTEVRAPYSGVITARNVYAGSLVKADSPSSTRDAALFEIAREDVLRVFVYLPQAYASSVHEGTEATLDLRERPGQGVKATVKRLSAALDPSTRTREIELHVANHDHSLLPGMFTRVVFDTLTGPAPQRIPASALLDDDKGPRVVCVGADNKVHYQPVQVLTDLGTEIELQSPLPASHRVVLDPSVGLNEGSVVTPVLPEATPSPSSTPSPVPGGAAPASAPASSTSPGASTSPRPKSSSQAH